MFSFVLFYLLIFFNNYTNFKPTTVYLFTQRIVQNLTWCLTMVWTSGLPVQQERNAPSSKFFITPANATAQHGNPSSSTVSQSCLVVRYFQSKNTNFLNLVRKPWICDRFTDVTLCCKPESYYVWWQPAPGVYENVCSLLVYSICCVLSWYFVKRGRRSNRSSLTKCIFQG